MVQLEEAVKLMEAWIDSEIYEDPDKKFYRETVTIDDDLKEFLGVDSTLPITSILIFEDNVNEFLAENIWYFKKGEVEAGPHTDICFSVQRETNNVIAMFHTYTR